MPELPEVATIVNGLNSVIIDKTIQSFEVLLPKTVWVDDVRAVGDKEVKQAKAFVEGKKIDTITRRGKMIIISISENTIMLIHLKMTGQLIYISSDNQRISGGHPTADMVKDLPTKSTRAIFHFNDGSTLYFNDQRQFGYIKLLTEESLAQHQPFTSFGPEPLTGNFNQSYFTSILSKHPKLKIKQILLDQSLIAGIGNIYADESLFLAKINPARPAAHLSPVDQKNLIRAIKDVLQMGLDYGGTSSQHYVQADGAQGTMQDHLNVYRRTDQPCPVCGTAIERTIIGGRGTHFCPHCQI